MSYTINLTNGNVLAVIPDGTVNTSACSQVLIGKNYAGYGQFLDDNFVHLLENAANSTSPTAPLTGQLWYNTTTGILQVWNGSVYRPLAVSTATGTAPTVANVGDLWYNTTLQQLNVCSQSSPSVTWLLVGPIYTSSTGKTGVIPGQITDQSSVAHVVANVYVNNNVLGIFSSSSTYTPLNAIPGFATVNPGLQLSTEAANSTALFQGTVTNAQKLNGLTGNAYMLSGSNTGTTGSSLTVGPSNDFGIIVSGTTVSLNNNDLAGNIVINTNIGNTLTPAISINGATGVVTIPNLLLSNSATSTLTVSNILNGGASGTGNIGNASTPFNRIFAQSTTALYADVAERFAADAVYEPGTVVELGGTAEITSSLTELSDSVFGVISTQAAYLMNGGAGSDETHPPVAMTGRVPVRVTGVVRKGDRLVSAGNGVARAAQPGEATAFNVIGRALVEKLDTGLGTVEAIVATK